MEYWLQRLSVYTIILAGLVLALVFGILICDQDFVPIGITFGFFIVVFLMAYDSRLIWIAIVFGYAMGGTANYLPLNFSYFEISILGVFGHFLVSRVAFKKEWFDTGSVVFSFFLFFWVALIFFHWFKQGIGLRVLGSEGVGARKAFSMVVGAATYILVVSLARGQWKLLNAVPLIAMLAGIAGNIPGVVSIYIPSLGGVMFRMFGTGQIDPDISGSEMGRLGVIGNMAGGMIIWLLACHPISDWWRPGKWWAAALALTALIMALESGFRNTLISFIFTVAVAIFITMGLRSMVFALPLAVVLAILTFGQGVLFDLPFRVQRSISFLPGKWSDEVVVSTESSNQFRKDIKEIYMREFFKRSPWIGTGFNYDKREMDASLFFSEGGASNYDVLKGFIVRKDYHVGWISLYDTYGVYGYICLIGMFFTELYYGIRALYYSRILGRRDPVVIWLVTSITVTVMNYFTTFGAIQALMPQLCLLGALTWCTYSCLKNEVLEKKKAGALRVATLRVESAST